MNFLLTFSTVKIVATIQLQVNLVVHPTIHVVKTKVIVMPILIVMAI